MSDSRPDAPLEQLWAGEFGDDYTERNRNAEAGRRSFWARQITALGIDSALEVGCNLGGNLSWIVELMGSGHVAGVDVNQKALQQLSDRLPGVDARLASRAQRCPFRTPASTWCSRWAC